jgi:hypothetical protein
VAEGPLREAPVNKEDVSKPDETKKRTHGDLVVFGAIAGIERVPRMRLIERKGEDRWRKRKWRIRHVCAEGSGAGEGRTK